jgi:DNA-binding CsgD family transcriptional regulator
VVPLVRDLIARAGSTPGRPLAAAQFAGERIVLDVVVDGLHCLLLAPAVPAPPAHSLSPREREIARMVAEGYPNKTIAAVLDISSWTVSTYLRRIFAKLDVRTRAAMVARVVEEGLVNEPAAGVPDVRRRR